MPDKRYYDALLAKAGLLRDEGRFGEADALLGTLADAEDAHLMGERTALGLPRRLHAALLRLAKARGDAVSHAGYRYLLVPPPDVLAGHARWSPGERQALALKNREAVPKLIHQVWIGAGKVPAACAAWAAHASRQAYGYRLWREADLKEAGLMGNAVFTAMLDKGDYPGAVDVARAVILSKSGGIYLDCDFYPARDDIGFDAVLPLVGLTAFAEEVPRNTGKGSVLLANSFIAAPPGHPVFAKMLAAFPAILEAMPKAPAWWATGPLIFTLMARAGTVLLAPADFVAVTLPDRADFTEVEKARAELDADGTGLLIAWKSW